MDVQRRRGGSGTGPDSTKGITEAYALIRNACRVAGLADVDADDVAQDVFLWLTQSGRLLALPPKPWLIVATQNFVRRYQRRESRRIARESKAVAESTVTGCGIRPQPLDMKLSLDRIEERLPGVEGELLHQVRHGSSFAEAVRVLGIPRGSRSFFRKRLIAHLASGLTLSGTRRNLTSKEHYSNREHCWGVREAPPR